MIFFAAAILLSPILLVIATLFGATLQERARQKRMAEAEKRKRHLRSVQ